MQVKFLVLTPISTQNFPLDVRQADARAFASPCREGSAGPAVGPRGMRG